MSTNKRFAATGANDTSRILPAQAIARKGVHYPLEAG
jgi:hypothetical protein